MPESALRHPLARALLALTFTTGLVDAVSYLGLGHVFTANMTGNIVFLGFGIAGGTGLPVVAPIVSLAAFLVGAGAARLASRLEEPHPRHFARALGIETLLIGVAAILAIVLDVEPDRVPGYAGSPCSHLPGNPERHGPSPWRTRPDHRVLTMTITARPLSPRSRVDPARVRCGEPRPWCRCSPAL